uniref:Uncharacterized protein n=1 Tax=Arundo donax TaxID=35708 RepID=A0A0A9ATH5_ARUDO
MLQAIHAQSPRLCHSCNPPVDVLLSFLCSLVNPPHFQHEYQSSFDFFQTRFNLQIIIRNNFLSMQNWRQTAVFLMYISYPLAFQFYITEWLENGSA